MAYTKLPSEVIDGRTATIQVDNDGRFYGEIADAEFSADSLADLRIKLRRAVRTSKARIKIEISILHNGRPRWGRSGRVTAPAAEPAVITGMHASNRNILIKRADGTSEQVSGGDLTFAERLSEADAQHWVDLCTMQIAAEKAVEQFLEQHEIKKIADVVKKAVEVEDAEGPQHGE